MHAYTRLYSSIDFVLVSNLDTITFTIKIKKIHITVYTCSELVSY